MTASWGAYEPAPSELHQTEQGRPRSVWRRRPMTETLEVSLDGDATVIPVLAAERVELRVAARRVGHVRLVDLALVNAQPVPLTAPDTARLYQARLAVTATDGGRAIFVASNDPELTDPPDATDDERVCLSLLYRHAREYAHGRQCAVDVEARNGDLRAWRLTTTCFPAADVLLTVPTDAADLPGVELDMAVLGSEELARNDLIRALRPLVVGYRTWLDKQEERIGLDTEVARYGPAAALMLTEARTVADRLDRAIDLLRTDPLARDAFRFANQTMADQRVRTELARVRLARPRSVRCRRPGGGRQAVPAVVAAVPAQLRAALSARPDRPLPSRRRARTGDEGRAQATRGPSARRPESSRPGLLVGGHLRRSSPPRSARNAAIDVSTERVAGPSPMVRPWSLSATLWRVVPH